MNAILRFVLKSLFKLFYITGLTGLIPSVLFLIPTPANVSSVFITSIIFVLIGFFGVYLTYNKIGETLCSLGIFTLLPGGIALSFMLLGKETLLTLLSYVLFGYEHFEPFINLYIQRWVPTLGTFTVVYLVLGGLLFFLGKKSM